MARRFVFGWLSRRRNVDLEPLFGTELRLRVQPAEHYIGVCDGGQVSTPAVGRRARLRACGLGADLQHSTAVDRSNAATPAPMV